MINFYELPTLEQFFISIKKSMRYSLVFLLLFAALASFAQPVNDDCDGIIELGEIPYCTIGGAPTTADSIFNNVGATQSDIGFGNLPTCFNGGLPQRDVWFSFISSDTILDYTITVMGIEHPDGTAAMVNPQVALYRGNFCGANQLAELACASADLGESMVELNVEGLTPGITYYLRINDYSASATPNEGAFKLCIDEIDPVNTIEDGSSSACSGTLYDSGGPDEDYQNDENSTFVICPNQPNQCINFTLTYYNVEVGDPFGGNVGDQIIFYDGDEANAGDIITTINGGDVAGGGGVCYQVQASSGCMTVQFVSDGNVVHEGFEGHWECSAQACETYEPISVDTDVNDQQIIDALSTPQTQVTITDINCDNGSYGTFLAGDNTDLGLERGLLLTSGDAVYAQGPNVDGGGGNLNADRQQPGDADLDQLSILFGEGTASQDACIIELDVYANTDELSFEYVFGSEEYPEFVDQIYNDIFAFLISGPGITGIPEIGGQENIAVLPDGSNTFVQINSVNNNTNWEYYRNNQLGQSVEYDGLTSDYLGVKKSLTARKTVEPCNTYHLKLAIADRGDGVWDSGVFISEISGGSPQVDVVFNSGVDYLIESCTDVPDEIIFRLFNDQDEPVTYDVLIGGTAIQGTDYVLDVPAQLTFQPGENELTFPITVLDDLDDMEGIETIQISLVNDFGCGLITLATLDIELHDILNVEVNSGADTARYCINTSIVLEAEGASSYFWTPPGFFDNPSNASVIATPTEDGWVYVEGQVGPNCTDRDSIYLVQVDPTVVIEPDTINMCLGDVIEITALENAGGEGFSWTPADGLADPNATTISVSPESNTIYTATVFINENCTMSDEVLVDVDILNPAIPIPDSTICQHSEIVLATLDDPNTATTVYSWTPVDDIVDPTSPTPATTPQQTTEFQLISTSTNGACADTSSTIITVLPANAPISPATDTIEICLGESVDLSTMTSTGSTDNLFWTPDNGTLSTTTGFNVVATPTDNTTYYTNFTVGECFVQDSVYIKVDSLPTNLAITADPVKDPYCVGELVELTSPLYEPALYPEITHLWSGGETFETPDSLYNMVVTTVDTFTFVRETRNGTCVQTEEITLNVITDEGMGLTPDQATICPGESVNLVLTSPAGGDITWSPTGGLSCSDCFEPVASPSTTTNYSVEINISDCLFNFSSTINVTPPPALDLIGDQSICLGESLQLNNGPVEDGVTYTWTSSSDPTFSSNEAQPTVSPDATTTYTVVADKDGCQSTASVTITIAEPASIEAGPDQVITSFDSNGNADVALEATLTGGSNGAGETFQWTVDGVDIPDGNALAATYMANVSNLPVAAIITYMNACEELMDTLIINGLDMTMPNIFSPNGDDVNAVFKPYFAGDVDEIEVSVFNRWGQLVFESKDPSNYAWDGNIDGDPAPSDVYIYYVKITRGGVSISRDGQVTLIR